MTVVGLRTVWELRGTQCIPLELAPAPKKSIVVSRSFGRPIEELVEMKEAVATYTSTAAEKLRKQSSVVSIIQIFIHTSYHSNRPYYGNSITLQLDQPTAFTPELVSAAIAGLERIFKPHYQYKRAGVMMLNITSQDQIQGGFFGKS